MCDKYLEERVVELEEKGASIPDELTMLEYAALLEYSMFSDDLNNYLRNGEDVNIEYECRSGLINGAIAKLPKYSHSENSLFRGVQLPKMLFNAIEESKIYKEGGFFSTSQSLERAEHFMIMDMNSEENWILGVFEIIGSNIGINLSNYTGEQILDGIEVLFPRNIEFQVVELNYDKKYFNDGTRDMFRMKLNVINT